MQLIGRRMSHRIVTVGTDSVLVGYPIPAGGILNGVDLDVRVIGPEDTPVLQAGFYGFSGFVVPVLDPDAVISHNAIWDAQIPKDVELTAGAFDIDTSGADVTPEYEIGTPDISAIVKLTAMEPLEIFRRRSMITVHSTPTFIAGTPDTYLPIDQFTTRVSRKVSVDFPSMVMFGFSAPDTLSTTQTQENIPLETEWVLLQYLEVALEQAVMSLIGLTEAGAESPFEESLAFIARMVESDPFETTAGAFGAFAWNVFVKATFSVSMGGTIGVGTLTSE